MTLRGFATQIVGNVITEQIFITEEDKDFISKCCFLNLVLAGGVESHQNDKTAILFSVPLLTIIFTIRFFLEKETNGVFNEVTELKDSTHGTFFGLETLNNPLLTGFELDWSSILDEFGEGNYHFRTDRVTFFGTDSVFSINYNLRTYSPELADHTIWIEWIQNGQIIDGLDFTGLNWRQSVRFPGFFGEKQTEFEEEIWKDVNFENFQIRNELNFTYKCEIGVIPSCIGDILPNLLQANDIFITDYNIKNHDYTFIRKPVRLVGIEETKYDNNRQAVYNLTFSDRKDNHIKINC